MTIHQIMSKTYIGRYDKKGREMFQKTNEERKGRSQTGEKTSKERRVREIEKAESGYEKSTEGVEGEGKRKEKDERKIQGGSKAGKEGEDGRQPNYNRRKYSRSKTIRPGRNDNSGKRDKVSKTEETIGNADASNSYRGSGSYNDQRRDRTNGTRSSKLRRGGGETSRDGGSPLSGTRQNRDEQEQSRQYVDGIQSDFRYVESDVQSEEYEESAESELSPQSVSRRPGATNQVQRNRRRGHNAKELELLRGDESESNIRGSRVRHWSEYGPESIPYGVSPQDEISFSETQGYSDTEGYSETVSYSESFVSEERSEEPSVPHLRRQLPPIQGGYANTTDSETYDTREPYNTYGSGIPDTLHESGPTDAGTEIEGSYSWVSEPSENSDSTLGYYNRRSDGFGGISNRYVRNFGGTDRRIDGSTGEIVEAEREITHTEKEISNTKRKISDTEQGIINITREITTKEVTRIYKVRRKEEKEFNAKNAVRVKRFTDYRPDDHSKYFTPPRDIKNLLASGMEMKDIEKDGLAVVIPFFNEPSHELQQTLNSLYLSWSYLQDVSKKWSDKKLYVFIIQDGWHKAHSSMKEYLKILYPKKIHGEDWWDYYPEFSDYDQNRDGTLTFILEKKNGKLININPQKKYHNLNRKMNITLMIKINNRRKHNSHEWFMGKNGFAESVNAEYLFMTDAFTLYNKTCVYHLVKTLDEDKKVSATTGRQRVMTRDQQGSHEGLFSFGYVLRMVQLFDFELTNAVYNGAFSLGGCLPVIPGPCGMYRASDLLQDSVRNWYFDVINADPDKTGSVLGNLRIAEDRLLSYSAVMKTEKERYMSFNPLAIFYFEGETDLRKLILQRRRWINGSVAGYIYLLFFGFMHFQKWNVPFFRKFYIWLLLFCQFMIYVLVSIAPALSIRIIFYEINYILGIYDINAEIQMIVTMIVLWCLYGAHVFTHHRYRFNYAIMYTLVLISVITTATSFGALGYHLIVVSEKSLLENIVDSSYVTWLALFVFFGPFLLSLMLSGRGHSTILMIKAVIPYMLMLPMIVAWFGSYAYSRTWDLSWGNRPADEIGDLNDDQRKFMQKKIKEQSVKLILVLLALNIGVFFIPLQGQIIIMLIFFALASLQMFFSFFFMIIKIYTKIKFVLTKCKLCCRSQSCCSKSSRGVDEESMDEEEYSVEVSSDSSIDYDDPLYLV